MKLAELRVKLQAKKVKEDEIKAKYAKLKKKNDLTTVQRLDLIEELLGLNKL